MEVRFDQRSPLLYRKGSFCSSRETGSLSMRRSTPFKAKDETGGAFDEDDFVEDRDLQGFLFALQFTS